MTRTTRKLAVLAGILSCLVPLSSGARSVSNGAAPRQSTEAHGSGRISDHRSDGAQRSTIKMAITVDDLPGAGPELPGYTHVEIVKDFIAVLRAHRVTHATGFVVGSMIAARPERREALDAWVQAGFEVGNHTYSHDTIGQLGLDGYMKDILANRAVVDPLEKRTGQRHSYFRFPYLEEGSTPAERKALSRLLAAQHYTNVRASVTFSDTDWADAYRRCTERGDSAAIDVLQKSYLENAVAELRWAVAASEEVLGRTIPLVLLLHPTLSTAKMLDSLLTAYEKMGVRYVPLEEVLRERAYTAYYDEPGGNLFDQASLHLRRPHPPDLVEPDDLIELICR